MKTAKKLSQIIKDELRIFKAQHPVKKAADVVSVLIIAMGILVSLYMNSIGRSLWVDEAMLAYSFSRRSLLSLGSGVFEWQQSAPLLYLYITKIITMIAGNTEAVLRSVSVFSYVMVLALTVYIARSVFRCRYSLQAGAFLANMNFMLQYSNMFKQYMSECIWVLLVIILYRQYHEKGLKWYQFGLACMVLIWGANPACFFMGGVLLYEFFEGIRAKDKAKVLNSLKIGVMIAASFALYYLYWLREVANSVGMQEYWQNSDFPLIPRSLADIAMARAMVYEIFITFREARLIMMALVLAGLIISVIWEKERYGAVILLGFAVALFASFIHMFPIADRLWCFSFPIFTILAFTAVDRMGQGSTRAVIGALAVSAALIASNNGISVYRRAENVFMPGEEANFSIAYLRDHIEDGDTVYVYHSTIPIAGYKLGYDAETVDGKGRIMWGKDTPNKASAYGDIERVADMDSCYILASHAPEDRIGPLFEKCRERGYLQTVFDAYDTPLYYYTNDISRVKAAASIELIDREDEDGTCFATIRVTNEGDTILNADGDNVRIEDKDGSGIGTNLWGNLAPGEHFDMTLEFDWNDTESVSLDLCQDGSLWFSELGTEPVKLDR